MKSSINDVKLTGPLIAALYTHVLVEEHAVDRHKKQSAPDGRVQQTVLKYLGNNEQRVTVLVSYSDNGFLPEDALSFLTRIISACNMNISDIAIVNTANQADWFVRLPELRPKKVIAFGTRVPGKDLKPFTIENADDILWLSSPPLDEFITDTEQAKQVKQKLWSCLKQLFELK